MKRYFLPLIAALALPAVANAETYWLILAGANMSTKGALLKVPMETMQECETAGLKVLGSEMHNSLVFESMRYVCVKGK